MVGIDYTSLRLQDLRRHAAAYASRSGVPIEIVSKGILKLEFYVKGKIPQDMAVPSSSVRAPAGQ